MLFSLVLECAISRVEANQDGSKLNGTHQVLIYDDDDNIFGGSVHILKKHTEALLVGTKEIGLDVKVDKTKHMGMSRDQNAGRSHSIKTDNSSFERVEQFKILFRKKLGADRSQKMLAIIRCTFCLPICYPKIYKSKYTEVYFCLFCTGVKLGR